MAHYQIDSYHVNVGAGDGAIHVLSVGPRNETPERRTALYVYFIDGGRKAASQSMQDTIYWIEKQYYCLPDGNLRFDAFIITHWDGDHYEGVLKFLSDQVSLSRGANPGNPGKIIIPRARYGKDTQFSHGPPQSFLYAPYWPNGLGNEVAGWGFDTYQGGKQTLRKFIEDAPFSGAKDLLQLRVGPEWLLGRNILRQNYEDVMMTQQHWNQMGSLDMLLQANPIREPIEHIYSQQTWPAMYCIAVNHKDLNPKAAGITNYTMKNMSSIALIIVWDELVNGRPHISHYFAGDAHDLLELRLNDWMGDANHNCPVVSMKLSHHGASTSNPLKNFVDFFPRNIVVSAGEEYGHPRWEITFALDVWYMWVSLKYPGRYKPFFPCQWPAYLVLDDWNRFVQKRFSIKMLDDTNPNNLIGWINGVMVIVNEERDRLGLVNQPQSPIEIMKQRKQQWEQEHFGQEPKDDAIKQKVCQVTYQIMSNLSLASADAEDQYQTVSTGLDWLFGPMKKDVSATAMKEPLAIDVVSAPFAYAANGRVEMLGRNYTVVNGSAGTIHRVLATPTLAALTAANADEPDLNRFKRYPFLGDDQPRQIDLYYGNPKWPSEKELGHLEEPVRDKSKYLRSHQRCDSWVYIESSSDSDDSWDELEGALVKTRKPAPQPVILRRSIPIHIREAAVYIVSENIIQQKKRFPDGAKVVALRKEHPLFGLVDTLHYEVFSLASVPTVNTPVSFAVDDDWYHWLGRFCLSKSDDDKTQYPAGYAVTMTTSQWELDKDTLPLFAITIPFGGRKLEMDSGKGAEHAFSRTDEDGTAVTPVALTNMLISRRTIVYGLNKLDAPIETNLTELADFIGLDLDLFPTLQLIAGSVSLKLDTEEDFRNVLWFRPGMEYRTHMRLQFHAASTTSMSEWLLKLTDTIHVDKMLVIARKKASFGLGTKADVMNCESGIAFLCQLSVPTINLAFDACIELSEDKVSVSLTVKKPKTKKELRVMAGPDGALGDIADWLSKSLRLGDLDLVERFKTSSKDDGALHKDSIMPRRIELMLDLNDKGEISGVHSASVHIEACLTIGKPTTSLEQMPIVFLFTFGWSKVAGVYLKGKLWAVTPSTPFSQYDHALPEFEEYQILKPITPLDPANQLRTLNLERLLSTKADKIADIPAGIPTEIYNCEIGISQVKPPPIALENLEIDASYAWGLTDPASAGFTLRLAVAVKLYLGGLNEEEDFDTQDLNSVNLHGQVTYDKGNWAFSASASQLNMMHLVGFWHKDDRGALKDFLGKIDVDFVQVEYHYTKGSSAAKQLTFTGQLSLGDVAKLELNYRNRGSEDWVLSAGLGAENKLGETAKIGQVLSAFIEDETLMLLPSAIRDAELKGDRGDKPLRVIYASKGGLRVLAVLVSIGNISLWFLQMRQKGGATKRIVKAMISKVSVDVPAFNATIHSPWEQLFFMWVQDTTPEPKAGYKLGITNKEYENLKVCLMSNADMQEEDLLLFKSNKKPKRDAPPNTMEEKPETVITAGSHLVVVVKRNQKSEIVLDHAFSTKKEAPKQMLLEGSRNGNRLESKLAPLDAAGAQKGTKAPFKIKMGPLSVENIGLWYKEGMLGITLDASLLMGPVGLSLLGFSLGVPFGGEYSLSKPPPPDKIALGLQGMLVALDRPPLTVAGGFVHDTSDPDMDKYAGGLVVGFKPWTFQAMGVYATVKKSSLGGKHFTTVSLDPLGQMFSQDDKDDKDTFTFAFIFVKLNGPLFSVGFADFAGLVGGFGMNSDILLPTVEQVVDFPFVKERDPKAKNPADEMLDLIGSKWFRPAEGQYWAAVGARITAFQMIAANLVLVVQFGGSSLLIGIFGVATCDVPALEAPVKFAHVELGIVCTFDVNSGVLKLEAQLSPQSFVLAPQCHLTGGLAMYAWFKADTTKNIQAGDWVLTIGGYHQAFQAPTQYPRPPRLGISWSLDASLSVTGEAYFAITPQVCMGGGRLHAALSLGALYVWFDAFVDFLINFEPFYFQLQARLAVGVRFTLDLWLVTVRINAEVSASLALSGPPFGGVVHVDFWVFGFDVKFGAPPPPPPPVKLSRFWTVVLKSSGSSPSSLLADAKKEDTAAILLTCEAGLEAPAGGSDQDPATSKWFVKGAKFSFLATFQFAVTKASLKETRMVIKDGKDKEEPESRCAHAEIEYQQTQVFAKPMQLVNPLHSEVEILITAPTPDATQQGSFHIMDKWEDQKWTANPRHRSSAHLCMGEVRNLDPSVMGNRINQLLKADTPTTMPLVTGLSVQTPEPAPAGDRVSSFDVIKDRMQNVYDEKTEPPVLFPGAYEDSSLAWSPDGQRRTWNQVRKAWADIGDRRSKKAVDLWAKRLGFDKETVEKSSKGKGKFNPLSGEAPKELLRRFEQVVPALPRIAVGN